MNSIQKKQRLYGLDLARYLAFVGMVIVNFKVVMVTHYEDSILSYFVEALEGRAAATFVILAGIGLGLSAKKGFKQTFYVTLKRALFLLVIGLFNTLIFSADIIHYYAFYFIIGALLVSLSNRLLLIGIIAVNIIFVVMIFTLDFDLGWDWSVLEYNDFWSPAGFVRNLFFNGWHPVFPWIGFFLFGIILSRLHLGETIVQRKLILWGLASFIITELFSQQLTAYASTIEPDLVFLTGTVPVPPMPLYIIAGLSMASVVIGTCLMLSAWAERIGLSNVLIPAGRQTLTLYFAHILLGIGVLEALGMIGGQSLGSSVTAAVIFCIIATVYALIWSKKFKRGPLETVMRKVAG